MNESELLIVVNDTKASGIKKNYYPELTTLIKRGALTILSYSEYEECRRTRSGLRILDKPLFNDEDVYMYNPYSRSYIKTTNQNLFMSFCVDKNIAVKEALLRMGAKLIRIKVEYSDNNTINISGKINGKIINTNADYNKLDVTKFITDIECKASNRIPMKDLNLIRTYLLDHGLGNDTLLNSFCESLEGGRNLSGREEDFHITYLNEVDSALEILSTIDSRYINASLDFTRNNNYIQQITMELHVEF